VAYGEVGNDSHRTSKDKTKTIGSDMATITVVYRDGQQETFDDSRSSYGYNKIQHCEGMVTIIDPYGKETSIPIDLIQRIEHFKQIQY